MPTPDCHSLSTTGNVEVDPSLLGAGSAPQPTPSSSSSATGPAGPRRKKHFLSSKSDPLFSELRDSNFAVVGATLNRVAKRINTDYEGRHAAKTIAQIRDFTGRLSSLQAEHQALRLRTFDHVHSELGALAYSVILCRHGAYGGDHEDDDGR